MNPDFTFAAVGDVHGHHHLMVDRLRRLEDAVGREFAFVVQVGDFECNRHEADLFSNTSPPRFKTLGDFPDFYEGRAAFPWPVFFIGGNHEPYGFLDGLLTGGEVAPNCHYLGRAGHTQICGLRVAFLSGIYSPKAFETERPAPGQNRHQQSWRRSTYFDRSDVERALAAGSADLLVVHDWPAGAVNTADVVAHDRAHRAAARSIGNVWARELAERLTPQLIVAGHMHYGYRSIIPLRSNATSRFVALGHIQRADSVACFEVRSGSIAILDVNVDP